MSDPANLRQHARTDFLAAQHDADSLPGWVFKPVQFSQGPAGLVVGIINVTLMGGELGSGTIGPDNRFSVSVAPLEASTRIGLAVNDTGSTGRQLSDYYGDDYKGPGAFMVPQVGYFQDTALVQP